MLLAILALTSCSSEDNSGNQVNTEVGKDKGRALVLRASSTDIMPGATVTFELTDDEGNEINGDITINGLIIKKKFTFTEIGAFDVVGVKNGFKNSNVVTVFVSEKVNL